MNAIVDKRRTLHAGAGTNPLCRSCVIREACNSGCPVERDHSGLAVDCLLKRTSLSLASDESGLPWFDIVNTVSRFQLASRAARVITIAEIRGAPGKSG